MNDRYTRNLMKEVALVSGSYAYNKYVRPSLKKWWVYKGTAAPLILSQKINKLMPATPARTPSRGRSMSIDKPRSKSRKRTVNKSLILPRAYKKPLFSKTRKTTVTFSGASSGKFSRGSRKFRKKAMVKHQMKGVNMTMEYSGTTVADNTNWLGHITYPKDLLYKQAVVALFMHIMHKVGCKLSSTAEEAKTLPAGTTLTFEYKLQPSTNYSLQTAVFGGAPGEIRNADTFQGWFTAAERPWTGLPETEFGRVWIKGATAGDPTFFQMQMHQIKVTNIIKSTLKIQNQTVSVVGENEADDVTNAPLYGKSYNFKGTELKLRKPFVGAGTAAPLVRSIIVGQSYYGICTPAWTVNEAPELQEPPQGAAEFTNCKAVGKAHIDPGNIKTSVLTDKIVMMFNTLFRESQIDVTIQNRERVRHYGHGRVFALEKMLNFGTEKIKLAYEHNYEVSSSLKVFNPRGTVKQFEKYP